jgi:predicted NAD-dependent protein-ADP-ribosyltransferase YbiA (DUF1768 family)
MATITMPLVSSSTRICDPVRRRRVEVLQATVETWKVRGPVLEMAAANNVERWAAATKEKTSADVTSHECQVRVVRGDMLETAHTLTKQLGKPVVCLNMANEDHPGGGYRSGAAAQEENMFRRSNAHFTLAGDDVLRRVRGEVRYTSNMTRAIAGKHGTVPITPLVCIKGREECSRDDLGYTPLADNEVFPFHEMRSAAIDVGAYRGADLEGEMRQRIDSQFATLIAYEQRVVVLSAFGCGAFENDPERVATLYSDAIHRYKAHLDMVVFSIFFAGYGPDNYKTFARVLRNDEEGVDARPSLPVVLDEPMIYLSARQDDRVHAEFPSVAEAYELPAWVPARLVAQDMGVGQTGVDRAVASQSKPYVWATEFENVHSVWSFPEPRVTVEGKVYKNSETYYQAQKPRPWNAAHWNARKDAVMRCAIRAKVAADPTLVDLLLATRDHPLLSIKRDVYWGFDPVHGGKNRLGALWEELRVEVTNRGRKRKVSTDERGHDGSCA